MNLYLFDVLTVACCGKRRFNELIFRDI